MKNKKRSLKLKQELCSLNDNIYELFSVEELEKRLQMSTVETWPKCHCHGTNAQNCTSLGENEY